MSQFGLEDKVCHCLISDDLLILIYMCVQICLHEMCDRLEILC